MTSTDNILHSADIALIAIGWLTLLTAGILCWPNTNRHSLLRHAPLRSNNIDLAMICFCIMMLASGALLGRAIAGFFKLTDMPATLQQAWEAVLASNVSQVFTAIAGLLVARIAFRNRLQGFGLSLNKPLTITRWALGGWIIAIAVCLSIGWSIEQGLELFKDWLIFDFPPHPVIEALQDDAMPGFIKTLSTIGALILAPIGEEILYRGIIQTSLQRVAKVRFGSMRHRWFAICVTGALFGLMHTATPQHIPALVALGIILGYVYERTGSLVAPILIHMMFNGKTLLWLWIASQASN